MSTKKVATTIVFTCLKIVVLVLIIYALFVFGRSAYQFGRAIFAGEAVSDPPGKEVAVSISDDMSVMEVGKLLERKGIIEDARVFWVQEKLSNLDGGIKKGNYILNTSQNGEEILHQLAQETEVETESER